MSDDPTIGRVRVKPGVEFTLIASSGFRLLGAIEHAARALGMDVTITSACDGEHSGPTDPHKTGRAYDVRSNNLTDAQASALLEAILDYCRDGDEGPALPVSGIPRSLATLSFFGFIEEPDQLNEHIHVQLRKGRTYPGA